MLRAYIKQALRQRSTYRPLNRIELDKARLLQNVVTIQAQHPTASIIPVLKGNAYGHGIVPVAKILNDAACAFLAVDGYFEAAKLRRVTKHPILVMGHILPRNTPLLDTKRCSFVVQHPSGLKAFAALGKHVRIHLEINTGMNRMGLEPRELDEYLRVLTAHPNLELEGVMSHLADADNTDNAMTTSQVKLFDKQVENVLSAGFTPRYIHIAQTAGSTKANSRYANAIRLGIGTYGINPLSPNDAQFASLASLEPVLELKSTLVNVIDLRPGDSVSYNATFTAKRPMRIGILPLGYYEGLPRALSSVGCVTTPDGGALPILGKVCMNHVAVDLTDTSLGLYSELTVISKDPRLPNSVRGLQTAHGLFPYTTVAGLSETIRREII